MLDGREREDHVEGAVRKLEHARVHPEDLEAVAAVLVGRECVRIREHGGVRFSVREPALAVDVCGDDASDPVRKPEKDLLVACADGQYASSSSLPTSSRKSVSIAYSQNFRRSSARGS